MGLHQMESGPAKNALKRPFEGGSTECPFYSLDIIAQVDHQNGMWMGYCDYWDHTGGMWDHWGGGMSCYIAIPIFGKFLNLPDSPSEVTSDIALRCRRDVGGDLRHIT